MTRPWTRRWECRCEHGREVHVEESAGDKATMQLHFVATASATASPGCHCRARRWKYKHDKRKQTTVIRSDETATKAAVKGRTETEVSVGQTRLVRPKGDPH